MKNVFRVSRHNMVRIMSISLLVTFVFFLGYIFLFEQTKKEYQTEVDKNMQIADMTVANLDNLIQSNKTALQYLATYDAVVNEQQPEIIQILRDFSRAQPVVSLYWVARVDGTIVGRYPDTTVLSNISNRDYFKASLEGQIFVGGPYVARVSGDKVIVISVPFYRDQAVAGVVGVTIPLSELQKRLETFNLGRSEYITLVNLGGQVICHPHLKESREGYSFENSPLYRKVLVEKATRGYFEETFPKSEREMHFFVTAKEAPWVVVVAELSQEFNYKINQLRERNFLIFILMVLFLVLIIYYFRLLRDMSHAEKNHQTEKLALVGELAAGIAHEIRNPLTSIKGFIQLISEKKGLEVPALYIDTVLEELDRINQIVGEMVVLAKPAPETKSDIALDKVLQNTVNLMNYQACQQGVQLILDLEPELPCIHGVSSQLKQVFINLIKNAIEAMPQKGTVTIQAWRQLNNVVIIFEDTGKGMNNEVIGKLGTPFFSTKETGTGLGLMITYRIIQNHKGKIIVQSKVGVGTRFTLSLPVSHSND